MSDDGMYNTLLGVQLVGIGLLLVLLAITVWTHWRKK